MYKLAILAVCLLMLHSVARSADVVTLPTQYGFTSETRTVNIDTGNNCPTCDRYDWELVSHERPSDVTSGSLRKPWKTTPACRPADPPLILLNVKLPRSGHYYLKVRACIGDTCSAWASTKDSKFGSVGCDPPTGFWLYGTVQPPGTPVFQ